MESTIMEHYKIFKCEDCGVTVKLDHSYTQDTPTTCIDCCGELKDTGREYYGIHWAIYTGIHKLFNWKGYQ